MPSLVQQPCQGRDTHGTNLCPWQQGLTVLCPTPTLDILVGPNPTTLPGGKSSSVGTCCQSTVAEGWHDRCDLPCDSPGTILHLAT